MEMAELVARSWWEQDGHFEDDWEAQHRSPGCVYFITLSLEPLEELLSSGVVMSGTFTL